MFSVKKHFLLYIFMIKIFWACLFLHGKSSCKKCHEVPVSDLNSRLYKTWSKTMQCKLSQTTRMRDYTSFLLKTPVKIFKLSSLKRFIDISISHFYFLLYLLLIEMSKNEHNDVFCNIYKYAIKLRFNNL